ncbi:hypothetical protein LXA43DRAFT_421419 [Ganoderma leucocontextum]|nr:hypothetical protein LXA43DRAFT_421419 [Ganoderma leucocontextum]
MASQWRVPPRRCTRTQSFSAPLAEGTAEKIGGGMVSKSAPLSNLCAVVQASRSKMASQSTSDAALVAFYATCFQKICCQFSVTALVVYDWVVTLSREVHLFWTGTARPLSAVLYFSNKYLNVLSMILGMLSYVPMSDDVRMPSAYSQVLKHVTEYHHNH